MHLLVTLEPKSNRVSLGSKYSNGFSEIPTGLLCVDKLLFLNLFRAADVVSLSPIQAPSTIFIRLHLENAIWNATFNGEIFAFLCRHSH